MDNSTNGTTNLFWHEPPEVSIFFLVVGVSVALAGIVGNVLVWMVITSRQSMAKKPRNVYLLSLAAADLGVLLMNYPIALSKVGITYFAMGEFFCMYVTPATETFFCASIWSIVAIAVDRYRHLVGARSLKRQSSLKRTRIGIAAIWFCSFVAASLPLYVVTEYRDGRCAPGWNNKSAELGYNYFLAAALYVLPLAMITFTYLQITRTLSASNRFHRSISQEMRGPARGPLLTRRRENTKLKRILTPLVILFAISMLPLTVLRMLTQYPLDLGRMFIPFFQVAVLCAILNSALNPILYYIVSAEFRSQYKQTVSRLCKACWRPVASARSRTDRDETRPRQNGAAPSPDTQPVLQVVSGV